MEDDPTQWPFKIHVYPEAQGDYISNVLRTCGFWEPYGTEVMLELFRHFPSVPFVDIGANLGWYSLVAASYGVRTLAFEPVPANRDLLIQSINRSGYKDLVEVMPIALGEEETNIDINIVPGNMGACHRGDVGISAYVTRRVNVCVKRFDEVYTHPGSFLVKMDVETMEIEVLRGMGQTLNRAQAVLIEISWKWLVVVEIMESFGFEFMVNVGFYSKEKNAKDRDKCAVDRHSVHLQRQDVYIPIKDVYSMWKDKDKAPEQVNVLFLRHIL